MRPSYTRIILWFIIILGILLRMTDVGFPDMATDEAQFALGASAAQPPGGMAFFAMAQMLFGANAVAVRSVSVALGIATVALIYLIARETTNKQTALIIAAIAAMFPSHILFSRLAYLSVPLCFAWTLTLLMFLQTRKKESTALLLGLFGASVLATYTKTQGLLLPGALLLGRIIETRRQCFRDGICWILGLSLIPILLYIGTHPGIAATLLLYGGNMYGFSGFIGRIDMLVNLWWHLLPFFLLLGLLSITELRRLSWPLLMLLSIGTCIGLVLGPAHEYYATYLVYWSIPMGILVARWKSRTQIMMFGVLIVSVLLTLGPRDILRTPWTHPLFVREGYWNVHAKDINAILEDEEEVIAIGPAGHHIRWYLQPRILVGKDMNLSQTNGTYLLLNKFERDRLGKASVLYEDGEITILRSE